jgi:hypothetical protein
LAANAIFRLAECYRRLGRTAEARSQYARILREFADQAPLVNLCRQYAANLNTMATAPLPAGGVSPGPDFAAGLVSWWAGEGNASDRTGVNNGLLEGAATFVPGEVGLAFSFDGTTADVKVPASPSLDVGPGAGLTIEAWIMPSDLLQMRPIVEWNSGDTTLPYPDGVHFWTSVLTAVGTGPGCLFANIMDTFSTSHSLASAPGLLTTAAFQHVAVTYCRMTGLAVIYLNGAVVAQRELGIFTPKTTSDLYLGCRPAGYPASARFAGKMDEVTLYSRALSAAEIQGIYAAGSAGKRFLRKGPVRSTIQRTRPTLWKPAPGAAQGE